MKGIAIYESPFMGETYVRAVGISHADYTFEAATTEDASVSLSGYFSISSQAKCAKEDTYDFETGALIALMRICGKGKTEKAYCETFFKGGDPGDCPYYQICKEPTIKNLKTQIEVMAEKETELIDANKSLMSARNQLLSESTQRLRDKINLKDKYVALMAENEKLKDEVGLKKDAINELKQTLRKGNSKIGDLLIERDKLKKENNELIEENEKLQKGYSAGLGRLVNINGVNYRECDEKGRVVWMTTQPENFSFEAKYIDTDALEALRGCQKNLYDVSKREKMWDSILKEGRTPVYVKREDIIDFLKECQTLGIKWSSGKMPLDTRPLHMSVGYDGVYFFIMTTLDLNKSKRGAKEFRHVMTWWCTADPAEVQAAIHYIPPMRWDLFKKGRRIIRVTHDNIDEFMTKCSNVLGGIMRPNLKRYKEFTHLFIMISDYHYDNKPTVHIMTPEDLVRNQHENSKKYSYKKIVNWEDVR